MTLLASYNGLLDFFLSPAFAIAVAAIFSLLVAVFISYVMSLGSESECLCDPEEGEPLCEDCPESERQEPEINIVTLPKGIPHYELLVRSGVKTWEDLFIKENDLTSIKGIGPVRAGNIKNWIDEGSRIDEVSL